MKAVILAAGQGSRLRPLTNDRPKAMIDFHGRTLLERQIDRFLKFGITDIAVVTGYCHEVVKSDYPVKWFHNHEYGQTNMVYSLFCAESFLQGDIIVSYGDILYEDQVLERLLCSERDIAVIGDKDWESYYARRFGDPYLEAESFQYDADRRLVSIGKANAKPEEIMAQYIGLFKLNERGMHQAMTIYRDIKHSTLPVGWGKPFREAYMTDFLQELVKRDCPIYAELVNRGWHEIDSLSDYELAKQDFIEK